MLKQLMLSFVVLMGFSSASALSIMPHPIEHTNWELSTYNGAPAEGSLSFDDRMMYSRFCNHVSQGYQQIGTTLYAQGLGMSTKMYCEGLPMTLENNFVIGSGMHLDVLNDMLTLITHSNIYVFTKKIVGLDDLVSTCIQAYDMCHNMCIRSPGSLDWDCAKKGCIIQNDAQCLMSTNDIDLRPTVCNMTHTPSFTCEGEHVDTPIAGGDIDQYGCKGFAGYSRNVAKKSCTRSREDEVKAGCELPDVRLERRSIMRNEIRHLQSYLKDMGYYPWRVHGFYGRGTQRAVQSFQRVYGIETTGVVGPVTRHVLQQVCTVR